MMKKKNFNLTDVTFDLSNIILLSVFMLFCIYPFYYILIYSLSDPQKAITGITLLPSGFTFYNYNRILQTDAIYGAALISLLRTVIGTVVTVVCCSLFAYILTKPKLYFRKFIYRFLVITMYLNAGLIPFYLTIRAYGLRNNFLVYILPCAISAFYIILLKTFIEQLPAALEESAMIDGAGYLTIFIKVIFPLSMPIIATIAVFSAVGQWNSWFDNYIFCEKKSLLTLQYILLNYLQESQKLAAMVTQTSSAEAFMEQMTVTPESARMTITMITVFPILLVYPFMQRYFVKGIMLGAVKG